MTTEKGKGKERDQGNDYGRWGFVLPETTMMKSHKASWRSAREYVTVHDASYTSVFRVGARMLASEDRSDEDTESALTKHLHQALVETGLAKVLELAPTELVKSHHVIDTVLVQRKANPQASGSTTGTSDASANAALAPVRIVILAGKRRFKQPSLKLGTFDYDCKEALIFVPPAADLHLRRALKAADIKMVDEAKNALFNLRRPEPQASQAYALQLDSAPDPWLAAGGKDSSTSKLDRKRRRQAFRSGSGKDDDPMVVESSNASAKEAIPLDDQTEHKRKQGYNIFELIGPRAAPLLQSVLKVHRGNSQQADEASLRTVLGQNGKNGKPSMVEVRVNDPRLSYPPKLKTLSTGSEGKQEASAFESAIAQNDELFWHGASTPRFSKGEIDSRRALNGIPGARLTPDSRDDIIPVVVIRDRLVQKPQMDRYTLIAPRGWGTAFFLSLVATHQSGASSGARVLGQHQLKHQRLELAALSSASNAQRDGAEASILSYPHNWLGTQAYAVSEKQKALARQEEWSRRPKGKRTEYLFASHQDWQAFVQSHSTEEVEKKLSRDRVGVARPYPFGGSHCWEWIVSNSERLFGKTHPHLTAKASSNLALPWLVARPDLNIATPSAESALSASHLATAMVAVKLQAIRKGTVMPLGSLMLAPSFDDHLAWVHHLDSIDHPALVVNRTAAEEGLVKMDKAHLRSLIDRRCEIMQLGQSAPSTAPGPNKHKFGITPGDVWSQYTAQAFDPEELHTRSADWNNTIGTVLDGDYSLGNGKGFGIGVVSLKAWSELIKRQGKIDAEGEKEGKEGRRRKRNPIETRNLLLMREVGTDVVRAVSAQFIPFA